MLHRCFGMVFRDEFRTEIIIRPTDILRGRIARRPEWNVDVGRQAALGAHARARDWPARAIGRSHPSRFVEVPRNSNREPNTFI